MFPPAATSMTLTMFACFNERRREISLIAVMGVPSRRSEVSILIVFNATISPERRSRARLKQRQFLPQPIGDVLDYSERCDLLAPTNK